MSKSFVVGLRQLEVLDIRTSYKHNTWWATRLFRERLSLLDLPQQLQDELDGLPETSGFKSSVVAIPGSSDVAGVPSLSKAGLVS